MLQKDFKPALRFMVVSDVHYPDNDSPEKERMKNAIKYAYEIAESSDTYKKLDALYVVGDFATSGSRKQMLDFKATLDENLKPETQYVLMMASHEYHGENGEEGAIERFTEIYNGMPLDDHKVINGFHFISLSTTHGCDFDEKKLNFAAAELKKARKDRPNAPIFFFQHPHITDTVSGSIYWADEKLYPLLMHYPQVIDFSGHSHVPINDPRSIHQKHFTSLGTGSLSYFELDEFDKCYGTCPPKNHDCAQMLIVEADENGNVRVYPYDVLTHRFFPMVWEIDTPWLPESFKYTDARYKSTVTPYFTDDAKISFSAVDEDSFSVTFPQAKIDSEYVNDYVVRVLDEYGTVQCKAIWSEYYYTNAAEELMVDFSDLESGKEYTVTVTAKSFWGNASAPIKTTIKTK